MKLKDAKKLRKHLVKLFEEFQQRHGATVCKVEITNRYEGCTLPNGNEEVSGDLIKLSLTVLTHDGSEVKV